MAGALAGERELSEACARLGVEPPPGAERRLTDYLALLSKWNRAFNLTAVRDPERMLTQHLVDCLAIVGPLQRRLGDRPARILDVGSGAGLPGVVLAVMTPRWTVSCIDAVAKKAGFIRQVAAELGLANLHAIHGRVEQQPLTHRYDIIVSRAFSSLTQFTEWTRHLIADDGAWLAMKGAPQASELKDVERIADVFHVEQLDVPDLDAHRCLVWMRPRRTEPADI